MPGGVTAFGSAPYWSRRSVSWDHEMHAAAASFISLKGSPSRKGVLLTSCR